MIPAFPARFKNAILLAFLTLFLNPSKCIQPQKRSNLHDAVGAARYLKDLLVVYSKDNVTVLDEHVEELQGLNADINGGFGGDHVWLFPIWTTNVSEGATSIEVFVQGDKNLQYVDLAKGAGGSYRYYKMIRNPTARTRIVGPKLYRTGSEGSKPTKFGYMNCSGDINAGRKGDYLYLCWQNIAV